MHLFWLFMLLSTSLCFAQSQEPYRIASTNIDGIPDSVWVLFPDIQAAKGTILFPKSKIDSPDKLHIGDSIMLDSTYQLDIKIVSITWTDSLKCTVICTIPRRQNAILQIQYSWFAGGFWVIEGKTLYEPLACDHLTISMYDKYQLGFGLSYSRNCE